MSAFAKKGNVIATKRIVKNFFLEKKLRIRNMAIAFLLYGSGGFLELSHIDIDHRFIFLCGKGILYFNFPLNNI